MILWQVTMKSECVFELNWVHLQFVCHFYQMMAMKLIKINDDVIENISRIKVLRQMQTNDDEASQ